ncbi:Uncharacterised protein [Mycobacteroides abscessus subsp. abscessus]|nr:Uncharacterised protein [Mycobacteroides abscessus subsp. abscessus]
MMSVQSVTVTVMVSVTDGCRASSVTSALGSTDRSCGPSPRLMATCLGCAGTSVRLGRNRIAPTAVGLGSLMTREGRCRRCTESCGAVQTVPGSPSVAAYDEP